MAKIKDILNKKFGKLTVIKISKNRGNRGQIRYECVCDCGNSHEVSGESIRKGNVKSCGCYNLEKIPYNRIIDREYATWRQLYNSTIIKRSKKEGYVSDISLDDFIKLSKMKCYYCELEGSNFIKDRIESNNLVLNFNGLDRINSENGYYLDNVVTCCKYCNVSKNTMNQSDFREFIIRLYNHYCVDK
jgi:hypothetical protein